MQFKITVPPQQLNSKILQTQLHKGREKQSYTKENLKFRDRTAKPKNHVTQETMKYIEIISIWQERHDNIHTNSIGVAGSLLPKTIRDAPHKREVNRKKNFLIALNTNNIDRKENAN